MSLLQNSNAISAGGAYNITDSLRLRGDASAYLERTFSTPTDNKKFTISLWTKISQRYVSGSAGTFLSSADGFNTGDVLIVESGNIVFGNGFTNYYLKTNQVLRDPSAWYHIIAVYDSANATSSDRLKLYINGERVTSFASATYPSLNYTFKFNSAEIHRIGIERTFRDFDGYMAEVNFVDGQALTPSDFGETNADGVWSPKEYTGTYGTNGFYLPMKETTQATGFNTVLYTGNGGTQSIDGVGFSPDLVWLKNRSGFFHHLYDSVRGTTKALYSNATTAETTESGGITAFNNNGFTLGNSSTINQSGGSIVAWCWDAGSSTVSNTDGTITSSVRANPASGFSIATFSSSSTNATIGHGLGSAPKMIIVKGRNNVQDWYVYHESLGAGNYILLNGTGASQANTNVWQNTTPTSSVFYFGSSFGTVNYVAYCFSEVAGFSKFGSYTGNGSTSGPTVTTGFRPAFVMFKNATAGSGESWYILDNTRDVNNTRYRKLYPNTSDAEGTSTVNNIADFNDDGFTLKSSAAAMNGSGDTIIYMAFADTRDFQWNFDSSGNKNNWTPNNINSNASSETTYDLMSDTPSLADEDTGNFATMNPLAADSNATFSNANLTIASNAAGEGFIPATIGFDIASSTGYYFEVKVDSNPAYCTTGFIPVSKFPGKMWTGGTYPGQSTYNPGFEIRFSDGTILQNGGSSAYGSGATAGDTWGFAIKNGKVWARNSSGWFNSGNPVTETNPAVTGQTGQWLLGYAERAGAFGAGCTYNFGQRPFKYTPPTGYKKLNTFNLPDSSIKDGSQYFDTSLYTGNGTTQDLTTNFSPDLVWLKSRSNAFHHYLVDSVRGESKYLRSSSTNAEGTNVALTINSDGYSLDSTSDSEAINYSGATFVGWSWRGSDSTAVSNTDGTITSTVSANPTSGFSIVTYTGTGSNATVGHGLGVAPKMIIVKSRSTRNWVVYTKISGLASSTAYLILNATSQQTTGDTTVWGNQDSTSTTFGVGTAGSTNANGENYVAYCFADVEGFSKFGSYTGNGSADGPFVYTGFKPRWLLIKKSSGVRDWIIYDTARDTYNVSTNRLNPNLSSAELTGVLIDLLSNGFKIRGNQSDTNDSGSTYIFAAFAENPLKNSLGR